MDKPSLKALRERLDDAPFDPAPSRSEWEALLAIAEAARAHLAFVDGFEDCGGIPSMVALRAALARVEE